ncbi:hypothetical protein LPJ53_006615, partial [Coemansia erecta]
QQYQRQQQYQQQQYHLAQQQARGQAIMQAQYEQQQQQIRSASTSLAPTASPSPMLGIKLDRPVSSDDICIICSAADHQMLECPYRMNSEILNRRMMEVQADRDISESKRFMLLSALRTFLSAVSVVSGLH